MKKRPCIFALSTAVSCLVSLNAMAIDIVDGVYQITDADDFVEYANLVSTGNNTIKGTFTADIDLQGVEWTPIGTEEYPFKGTLDGKGHRVLNMVIESDKNYQGLFGHITGGSTIKNLIIDKTCSVKGNKFVGGIAGGAEGSGTAYFQNVGNEANITADDANAAGIIGVSINAAVKFVIENAYNTGDITGSIESAAVCGYVGNGSTVTGFYNTGVISGVEETNKLFRNSPTAKNCFDIEGIQGDPFSAEMAASGELTFRLNGLKSDDVQWYQNIDAGTPDAAPVLDASHGVVYLVGRQHCNGSPYNDASGYSNTNLTTKDDHDYVDGVCSYCLHAQPDYIAKNDTVYEIGDAKQLYWLACHVNELTDEKTYVRLTNDIDFSEYTQTGATIGIGGHDFDGWFDGRGHKVTISYNSNEQYTSLFHFCKGIIRNLVTEGDIVTTENFSAGIVGLLVGSDAKVENCVSYVVISSEKEGDTTFGGIVGITQGGGVYNSSFLGSMEAPQSTNNGGIIGWSTNEPTIQNCYVDATFNVTAGDNNIIARSEHKAVNCYYTNAFGFNVPAGVKQVTDVQLETGELAYLLNGMRSDTVSWYQNIDNGQEPDAAPVPFDTENRGVVYAVGTINCDGSPSSDDGGFSNTNNSVKLPHEYVDGVCSFCKDVDVNHMTPVDGYYEISTPQQLNWFARYATYKNVKANGKLLADIDFTEFTADSVMIGGEKAEQYYRGTFDGQGHCVTVAYSRNDSTGGAALFGICENVTIRNISVKGSIRSGYMIGGILIKSRGTSLIENCISSATLESFRNGDATIGGIAAAAENHGVYRNCGFVGSIIAENGTGNGGIMGYANGGVEVVLENCYVAGDAFVVPDDNNSAMLCRNAPTISNCYYVDPGTLVLDTHATEVSKDQVTNGELCFFLNNNVSGGTPWVQAIGTDAYPTPLNGEAKVYANGKLNCDGAPLDVTYANEQGELTKPGHAYSSDGICGNCNARLISTPQQLLALSNDINSGFANSNIIVDLANDLDMSGIKNYVGIGTEDLPFQGRFDGHNHTVSNLVIDTIAKNQGLFGIVSAGAEIRNVTLDATCSVKVRQAGYAAGIAAGTNGTGLVVIENCGNEANITAEGPNAAGILGVNYGATVLLRISNCYNTGTITGTEESAGISGWLGSSAELTNCYNVGKVKGIDGDKTFARFATDPIFNNCYETVGKQVTKVTDEDVVNGGLCYALNDSVSGGEVFFQTLGTDNHPVLFKNHQKVFEINGKFTNDIVGIKDIANDIKHGDKVRIYSTDGILLPGLQKGINIVRKADRTTQKVFVK